MSVTAPVSWGELLDRITILEIKAERMTDPVRLANVGKELSALVAIRDAETVLNPAALAAVAELKAINERLWEAEDAIRACEARQDFGDGFVDLARSVYITNDRRAALKRQLNELMGSDLVEEKSYTEYRAGARPT